MTGFAGFDTAHHLCGIGIRAHDHLLFHDDTPNLISSWKGGATRVPRFVDLSAHSGDALLAAVDGSMLTSEL
jgi:hypothetical protein